MIARLSGTLLQKTPNQIVIDIQGVGYAVQIPLSTFYQLGKEGSAVALQVYTHVREDSLALFGFLSDREKGLFEKLISISGIGPRLGITIMSGTTVDDLIQNIRTSNLARLTRIPGVGKKTAERIILELRDKMSQVESEEAETLDTGSRMADDVVSALVNLGYPQGTADHGL